MRAGIATGKMVVGDAGPPDASDFTVLGDVVNLAARLESANKAFGTQNLVNADTQKELNGRFLVRPIANLIVVGKRESVVVYEVLAPMSSATEAQKRLAHLTLDMFQAFAASQCDDCEHAIEALEAEFGASKLTDVYREKLDARRQLTPDPAFRGEIELSMK